MASFFCFVYRIASTSEKIGAVTTPEQAAGLKIRVMGSDTCIKMMGLMTGGTDARFYSEVSDNCVRFAPLYINAQQYASIHGLNENIHQGALPAGVDFYKAVIRKS